METIEGSNRLLLTCRVSDGGVTLARVETPDAQILLPETIWGLPVTAVGDHAFTPGHREAEGDLVRVICGVPAGQDADNSRLASVALPRTLRTVGDYAFYNCAELARVCLTDTVESWGGSVFMNCRALSAFTLRLEDGRARPLSYLADELTRELDVTLAGRDGGESRFLFPEYREFYEENSPAHHFDYTISGGGYPYHHCFRERAFRPADYDALWDAYLRMEHDGACALRIAWLRLHGALLPERTAGEKYLAYLRRHAAEVLTWLLERRDDRGVAWFLKAGEPDRETLSAACGFARTLQTAEAQALMLQELHRRFPAGGGKRFEL